MGESFVDEIDCANFFDQIDDLIEFPPDTEGENVSLVGAGDCCKDFQSMWNEAFPESDPIFSGSHGNDPSDLAAQLSVPYEDIVQLEWLSTFVEESFSGAGMTLGKENAYANNNPPASQFQTSSPVSVLESSSSSSSSCTGPGKTLPVSPNQGPQRARSKRPRPTTFNPRAAVHLICPSSSFIDTPGQPVLAPPEAESFCESPPVKKAPKRGVTDPSKKKKVKITQPFTPDDAPRPDHATTPVRKCLHCEITKTPQWRAGPMGPKTLCNACGVRYKSGRLFPEYRPAASPTFVPSIHSNSHKKVVEMRAKGELAPASSGPNGSKPVFAQSE